MTPSKADQLAEAASRSASSDRAGVIPSLSDADAAATATDNGGDPAGPPDVTPAPARAAEAAPPAPPARTPPRGVVARDDIVARFRADRDARAKLDAESVDDLADFTNGGIPQDMLEPPEEVDPEPEPEIVDLVEADPEPAAPQKRKLKVRGADIELTSDEIDELARKQLAADDYLDESKNKVREASELLRQAQEFAQRVGMTTSKPPAGDPDTLPAETPPTTADAPEPHEDVYTRAVERIQLGETADAATALRELIQSEAKNLSKEGLEAEQLAAESSRSMKILTDFRTANSDLAQDRKASAAIEAMVYDLQREDLKSIGVSEDKLPQNPADIARWHHWYRAKHPDRVKTFDQLLNAAKDDVVAWRKPPGTPEQPAVRVAPRVEVQVDRTARRAAIKPQPTSTTQPRPPAGRQAAAEPDRSAVVQRMIADRARARQPAAR